MAYATLLLTSEDSDLARWLLRLGHTVRILTKHPDGVAALEMQRLGAVLYYDSGEVAGLARALRGCDGVYAPPASAREVRRVADRLGVKQVFAVILSEVGR